MKGRSHILNDKISLERDFLIFLLKLTRRGVIKKSLISTDAKIPVKVANELLKKLHNLGLIRWRGGVIGASYDQRIKIAIRAIGLGTDPERACNFLKWTEFESVAVVLFQSNNYTVKMHFRFKWDDRWWEIDIIAYKAPLVFCVDCKHWHRGWRRSAIKKSG